MRKLMCLTVGVGMLAGSAFGSVTITPNDDTYIDETATTTVRDNPNNNTALSTAGLFCKNQTGFHRVGFMEYTIPSVTAATATWNATYFRSASSGTNGNWTFQLLGSTTAVGFDENTLTWSTAQAAGGLNNGATTFSATGIATPSPSALSGGNGTGSATQDVTPNVPVSVDITTYFNTHAGQTIVFKLQSTTSSSNTTAGGTFQDREFSRRMQNPSTGALDGATPDGPFISYTEVPEPAAGLLLIAALPLLRHRRH